jgi:eukaryotic-like serine/threonine-protein kinase
MLEPDQILPFVRSKQYRFVKYLGRGGLGTTVLLLDDAIGMHLACKKYMPAYEEHVDQYYDNFIREMSLMFGVYHPNVVRIFNCFPYPKDKSGFILMEYINGSCIDEYIQAKPSSIEDIFLQVINAFEYLERVGVLHRDIRTSNILVTVDGVVKIIDFGFGKRIDFGTGVQKSISLAWPYSTPAEFLEKRYDFSTEIYFVGKMFETIISENGLNEFAYARILSKMTERLPKNRYCSFRDVLTAISEESIPEINFTNAELEAYHQMADFLSTSIRSIRSDSKYIRDPEVIIQKLEELYRCSLLESWVQDSSGIVWCFLTGSYIPGETDGMSVEDLRAFIKLFKTQDAENRGTILSNLWLRLGKIPRFPIPDDDDIPF